MDFSHYGHFGDRDFQLCLCPQAPRTVPVHAVTSVMHQSEVAVMSDSLRPHRLQPARLRCPWDSPGTSTGVDCHFLLQGISPTQGSNPGLPHCRQRLYCLSHQSPQFSTLLPVRQGLAIRIRHMLCHLSHQSCLTHCDPHGL